MSKESTLSETYSAIQSLHKGTVKDITDLLRTTFSAEWAEKQYEAARKQTERDLKVLVQMNLIEKDESQKTHRYIVKRNTAYKSEASKHYDAIQKILKEDETLMQKVQEPLSKLMNELESPYFIKKNVEDISNKAEVLSKLEFAINEHLCVNFTYKNREYKDVKPLKIAEFEGLFYLLWKDQIYLRFRISEIENCSVTRTKFTVSEIDELKIKNWHNVWHNPNQQPNRVKLWISDIIIQYFYDKNIFYINENKHRVKECSDGVEYYVEITHPLELLPQLMYWLPRITILEDIGELDILGEFRSILQESIENTQSI